MQESLVDILARLESEVKELKAKVLTLESKKVKPFDDDIKELKAKVLTLESKKTIPVVLDVKKDIIDVVTVGFITELYKRGK